MAHRSRRSRHRGLSACSPCWPAGSRRCPGRPPKRNAGWPSSTRPPTTSSPRRLGVVRLGPGHAAGLPVHRWPRADDGRRQPCGRPGTTVERLARHRRLPERRGAPPHRRRRQGGGPLRRSDRGRLTNPNRDSIDAEAELAVVAMDRGPMDGRRRARRGASSPSSTRVGCTTTRRVCSRSPPRPDSPCIRAI